MTHRVLYRRRVTVNTDPQRRCYDGCHFSSREEWTPWALVCDYPDVYQATEASRTFKVINPAREYKVVPA